MWVIKGEVEAGPYCTAQGMNVIHTASTALTEINPGILRQIGETGTALATTVS